jgi:hypothetical protein
MRALRGIFACIATCCALVGGLAFSAVPALAVGPPTTISSVPSSTEPYYACPTAEAGDYKCEEITEPAAYDRELSATGGAYPNQALRSSGLEPTLEPAEEEKYGELEGLSPQNLWSAYKLTGKGGAGETVAIVDAYNYPDAEADLKVYRSHYGLSECTRANGCFKKLNQEGASSTNETSSVYPEANVAWSKEMSLDLDMVSAICQECHIVLVEAKQEGNELDTAETEAASLAPAAISDSWGRAEETAETSRDVYFDHPGIPIVVASGDYGYGVEYPSASPYVISAGGTVLSKASNARGWNEEVWADTGSGCSAYELEPIWQEEKSFPKACGKYRTTDDVAAVAYHLSAYDSYEQPEGEKWRDAMGTSASTPIIAGLEALSSVYARKVGADAFYKKPSMLFHISTGSNGSCGAEGSETYYLCHATKEGYNGPTGWGTPDGPLELASAAPTVTTKPATSVTETGATLNGMVDPNGAETKYYFEYGTTESYGSKTAELSAGTGESSVEESAALTGLTLGTKYDFRIVATNVEGTSHGTNQTFTPSAKPSVETTPATSIGETEATLKGTVNPRGLETKYYFEYGTTESYGARTAEASAGSGTNNVEVSKVITGLTASTTYYFRIVATNGDGTTYSTNGKFSTTGKPTVETKPGARTSGTEVTLYGSVNPRRLETKYYFEYGATASYGAKTAQASAGEGMTGVEEKAILGGLVAKDLYHFRIVATNSSGTTYGSDRVVTAFTPEFKPAVGQSVTGTFGVVHLALGADTVTCQKGSSTGSVTGASTVSKLVMTLTGCEGKESGGKECEVRSLGATNSGEIVTRSLKGSLGVVAIHEAASGVGLLLEGEESTNWWGWDPPCIPSISVYGELAGEVATIGKASIANELTVNDIREMTLDSGEKVRPIELGSEPYGLPFTFEGGDNLTFGQATEVT